MFRPFQVFAAALVFASSVSQAQHPQTREGFGMSFGIGGGRAAASCDFCSSDREGAVSGYLRFGGYLRPTLFLGGETHGWVNSDDGADEVLGFYTATAQWYPNETRGFYLKGGLGVAAYVATEGFDNFAGRAPALVVGVGHDFRVGRNFSLTPYANYLVAANTELEINDASSEVGISTNVFQIGVGFTWH